jgi:hypothetical protein
MNEASTSEAGETRARPRPKRTEAPRRVGQLGTLVPSASDADGGARVENATPKAVTRYDALSDQQ